jgi:hypothetical protein
MKSTRKSRIRTTDADMPAEYQLDWSKAKPNPYAARLKDTVAVVLARTWLKCSRRRSP